MVSFYGMVFPALGYSDAICEVDLVIGFDVLLFGSFVSIIDTDGLKHNLARVHPDPPLGGCDRLLPRVEYDSARVK